MIAEERTAAEQSAGLYPRCLRRRQGVTLPEQGSEISQRRDLRQGDRVVIVGMEHQWLVADPVDDAEQLIQPGRIEGGMMGAERIGDRVEGRELGMGIDLVIGGRVAPYGRAEDDQAIPFPDSLGRRQRATEFAGGGGDALGSRLGEDAADIAVAGIPDPADGGGQQDQHDARDGDHPPAHGGRRSLRIRDLLAH